MKKQLLAALAALTLAAPIAAHAQEAPSYAAGATNASTEEDVHGRVVGFDGSYTLTVRDERGFIDNVQLHDGTIINPTGITLAPGMVVNILGYDAGDYLAANEIDTPYTIDDGEPYFDGQVWSYWGPSVDLAFFFGNVGWWHGGYFGGPFAWRGGVRVYHNVRYTNVYRDGYHVGYHNPNITRVHENPVPLARDDRPSYASRDERSTSVARDARPGYATGASASGYRGSYAGNTYSRGSYGSNSYSRGSYGSNSYSRGNYQPAARGGSIGSRPASAPAHESHSSGGHSRR